MPSQQSTTFSPTELAYLHTSLSLLPPIRLDARSPTTFRPLIAETDLLPSANGSARLCFADGTDGIAGVKAEVERTGQRVSIGETSSDGPDDAGMQGTEEASLAAKAGDSRWVEVTIDLPGQREDDAMVISLTQMIHEGLIADGTLLHRLYINHNWHWKLYIDILLLSPASSYPLPLLSLSTHLALLSTRLPALISQAEEDPLFNDDWEAALPLYPKRSPKSRDSDQQPAKPPVSIMLASVASNLFFDPSREELAVADAVAVVTVTSTSSGEGGARVLAIRTLDPPAAVTSSSSAALGGEPGFDTMEEGEGIWKPKRGGMKRGVLTKAVSLCSTKGGVGEEVLGALEGFV